MGYSEPTTCLRINPDDGTVTHEIMTGPDRYREAVAWSEDREGLSGGPPSPGPYSLAAAGAIVELAHADGALRHHVFVPAGQLEHALLASKLFCSVTLSGRLVVLEERRLEGVHFVDRN